MPYIITNKQEPLTRDAESLRMAAYEVEKAKVKR